MLRATVLLPPFELHPRFGDNLHGFSVGQCNFCSSTKGSFSNSNSKYEYNVIHMLYEGKTLLPCSRNGWGCNHINHVVSPSCIAVLLDMNHDPPLKLYGIPARYANATYSAASKAGQLEVVQRDLDAFQHVRKPF